MEFTQFTERLKKLNPDLRVGRQDYTDAGYDDEFRNIGLFNKTKYLFAVPRQYVPKWSFEDPSGRILARGWVAAVEMLILKKLVDRRKAEQTFGTQLFEYPQSNRPKRIFDIGLKRV